MRVGDSVPKISGIYTNNSRGIGKTDTVMSVKGKKDQLSISNTAKDYQTVMKALKEAPDVRQDKVEELSRKYQSGMSGVAGNNIADKLLQNIGEKK